MVSSNSLDDPVPTIVTVAQVGAVGEKVITFPALVERRQGSGADQ